MSFRSWLGQRIGLSGDSARKFWAYFASSGGFGPMTPEKAMQISAFWRGVRLRAETIATLPPSIYGDTDESGRGTLARGNQYDLLARVSPNDEQTPVEFWEGMIAAESVVGNGYARLVRIGKRVVSMEPLDPTPSSTYPFRNSQGELRYRARDWHGRIWENLAPEDVFHLKGFSFGGDAGLSTVLFGAMTFHMASAGNKTATQSMASGLAGNGVLETNQIFGEDDRNRLQTLMEKYQSEDGMGKLLILEGGMKYNRLSLSAVDAALLGTLGWSVEEIARWLRMPPILLGHSGAGQTMWGTGVESIIQSWYNLGLRADITRVEKAFQKRVIQPSDRSKFYLKFNVDGLLRGDSTTRALVDAQRVQNGTRSRNEVRGQDDLGPIPGGELYTAQTNLAPLDMLGQTQASGGNTGATFENMMRAMIEDAVARRSLDAALVDNARRFLPPA